MESVQSNSTLNKNIEELCDVMIEDLIKGCPEMDDVKCGMIGEVASNYPISGTRRYKQTNKQPNGCKYIFINFFFY